MDGILPLAGKLLECCALIAVGYGLKSSALFENADGQTAFRLATCLTLPSLLIQAVKDGASLPVIAAAAGVCAITTVLCYATARFSHARRHKRERALLVGSCVGLHLGLVGYPFIEAVWGHTGVQALMGVELVNLLAACVLAPWAMNEAGAAFPSSYKHADGGVYKGEWLGLKKEGLGTYIYPSGAKYEGEWRNNVKEGRGVYYFPKGGVYEGDWAKGTMTGIGVRTWSTGKVQAGRWANGRLESSLEAWQCSNTVDGACGAALAARRVAVGQADRQEMLQQLLLTPVFWGLLVALVIGVFKLQLPPTADAVTSTLAAANTPLVLLAAGLMLSTEAPQARMFKDLAAVLATRSVSALLVGANLLLLAGAGATKLVAVPIAAATLACLSPISPQVQMYAKRLRLNEPLLDNISTASQFLAVPLICLLSLVAAASGLLAPTGPSGVPVPFLVALLLFAAGLSAAAAFISDQYDTDKRVKMVFAGSSQTVPASATMTIKEIAAQRLTAAETALRKAVFGDKPLEKQETQPGSTDPPPSTGAPEPPKAIAAVTRCSQPLCKLAPGLLGQGSRLSGQRVGFRIQTKRRNSSLHRQSRRMLSGCAM